MIETRRLRLKPVERRHREAFQQGKGSLGKLLGVAMPDAWPHFPEAMMLGPETAPAAESPAWEGYFYIHPADGMLIGDGGFKGPPNAAGEVEIGYQIATEYWNQGYATEAARALVDFAFAHQQVMSVLAHTLAEKNASNTVLQRVGMVFDGEVDDPEDGPVWRWRINRARYESPEVAE